MIITGLEADPRGGAREILLAATPFFSFSDALSPFFLAATYSPRWATRVFSRPVS